MQAAREDHNATVESGHRRVRGQEAIRERTSACTQTGMVAGGSARTVVDRREQASEAE
jgi:hypothetical protein